MRLIDADKLIADLKNPDLCNVTSKLLEILLYNLKSRHMAEDMWEPVSPEERKKYCERYDAILKAVNVLEELQSEKEAHHET